MLTVQHIEDYVNRHIDWAYKKNIKTNDYHIVITLHVKESVYIMMKMTDFDFDTIFGVWKYESLPAGMSIVVEIFLFPDEEVIDGTFIL